MPLTDVPTIEVSTEIAAAPSTVWSLVTDPRNIARWSPQNFKTFLRGRPQVGAKFVNLNRRGLLIWPTQSMIVRYDPEREMAFRVRENWTVWSFVVEPTATGTTLIERREAPKGISDLSVRLTNMAFGGTDAFAAELRDGMTDTLAKIKAEAERG